MTAEALSPSQSSALLDILTHAETYAEIRDFRYPGSLRDYGPPFRSHPTTPSTSPALQTLVSRFLLNFPGVKDLSKDFWQVQIHEMIEALEKAELSESYDKGLIGIRRTLATAISALIEYPVRGTYGGFTKIEKGEHKHQSYDLTDASDLSRAFQDFVSEAVYGTALDDLVKKSAETDNLADHTPLVQAVHEFMLVNVASLMHFTLVMSPKGQYLLKLIENANKLVPYIVIKNTLKIGNVASMINAMMKVVLAKMSVASMTNWIGLTANRDDGQNLMQYIISTVLSWDNKDLESRALKIEKERPTPQGKEQLTVLKSYPGKSREYHESIRNESEAQSISVVTAIFKDANIPSQLTEQHHQQALEYLGIHLAIRDRKQLIQVLCHSHPDHLTQAAREAVAAYEPVIRRLHNAVDLSGTVGDAEHFIKDTLKVAKVLPGKDGKATLPTVGDFVQLLRKHQSSCHKFIYQCCKNGEELTGWYLTWANAAASQFRRDHDAESPNRGAGDLTEPLSKMYQSLDEKTRAEILHILEKQSDHIEEMHAASASRLASVLKIPPSKNPAIHKILAFSSRPSSRASSRPSSRAASPERESPASPSSPTFQNSYAAEKRVGLTRTATYSSIPSTTSPGPGAYLSRWQDLLDHAKITPLTQKSESGKTSCAEEVYSSLADAAEIAEKSKTNTGKPDVQPVLDAFLADFRQLLAKTGCNW